MPINEASSIKDLSGKTVQFNSQQGPKTAHNYWNLARPHDLFSSCKLLQANTRKSWNFMTLGNVFTAWQETLSFSLFLTIISSLFSIFCCSFSCCSSVRFSLFTRALSCSFSRCSTAQFSRFVRALSPAVCHWHSACLPVPFLVLSPVVCHWYSACLLVPFLVLSPVVCHWYSANELTKLTLF